ncbi:MAG TPA: glycosyl hydrolase [Acidimicrobiales bacterium]|nr:glycosyl hydrolase [Acidimicrobiales bacterium]
MMRSVRWTRAASILAALCLVVGIAAQANHEPASAAPTTADANATAATSGLLSALAALPAQHRLGIGQQIETESDSFKDPFTQLSGAGLPLPKVMGADVRELSDVKDNSGTTAYNGRIQYLKDHAAAGGWVTLSWHVPNPFYIGDPNNNFGYRGADGKGPNGTNYSLSNLLPGGDHRTQWVAQLNDAASVLKDFSDAGIPVIFRPLHEANAPFFWWARPGVFEDDTSGATYINASAQWKTDYIALWKDMVDYLTNTKGLHNLLFVYAASSRDSSADDDPLRIYPGDGFVDAVGLDHYDYHCANAPTQAKYVLDQTSYDHMTAKDKPLVLEAGPFAASKNDWPAITVLNAVKADYPKVNYALYWTDDGDPTGCTGAGETAVGFKQISSLKNPGDLMNDPYAFTLASKEASSTSVTSSKNPSIAGDSVTFTATVTPLGASGTVQFKSDGTNIGAAAAVDGQGKATVSTSTLAKGTHTITAVYSGDGTFATSTGTLGGQQVVDAAAAPTTTTSTTPSTTTTSTTVHAGTTTTVAPTGSPTVSVSPTQLVVGQIANVTGSGFPANTPLQIVLQSTPVNLATVTSSSTGAFAISVTIPSGTLPGDHHIVVSGANASASAAITVAQSTTATTSPRLLSRTGGAFGSLLAAAGFALVLGALLVAASERRGGRFATRGTHYAERRRR